MRDVRSSSFHFPRPHRITRSSKQIREKRTAKALLVFGAVLACLELYVIFAAL
ncbi:hypothetical protein HFO93_29600 [Rhizobium leguminosarum]|uniref:hypothetical protein n=1 Tax=Rhizobium leguminosarum TaxID=384 RepID=UPI001C974B04|nr:hypothetical protein [Rhizobium leguminosarum]MBY5447525.1 hypothetical protein [Rhizobium leguminosarum]